MAPWSRPYIKLYHQFVAPCRAGKKGSTTEFTETTEVITHRLFSVISVASVVGSFLGCGSAALCR
jgi:hypothetical protein